MVYTNPSVHFGKLLVILCVHQLNYGVHSKPSSCPSAVIVDSNKGTVQFPSIVIPTPVPKMKTTYDAKGLQPFYNLANSFMNTVQDDSPPKFEFSDFMKKFNDDQEYKDKITKYELPILITAGVGVLFALLFPIIGFCFCCCRCCGNCGGEMVQKTSDSENTAKCCICTFILVIVGIFLLCGVLFMYVMNNRMHKSFDDSKKVYMDSVDEAFGYANTTLEELKALNGKQLPCAIDLIRDDISDSGVKKHLGEPIQKLIQPHVLPAINKVIDSTKNVSAMSMKLEELINGTQMLRADADKLSKELNDSKKELDSILSNCSSTPAASECSGISSSGLEVGADYGSLPDVQKDLDELRKILNQNFSQSAQEGRKVYDDIPQTVLDKAKSALKDIRKLVDDGSSSVNNTVSDYEERVDKLIGNKQKTKDYYNDVEDNEQYEKYRWYAFIGLTSLMALITVFLMLGLVMGTCSYKKDVAPTHRTTMSHAGGNCLMASVACTFLLSFIFFLVTALFFLVGVHLHITCREVKDAKIIDTYFDAKINGTKFEISEFLAACRRGESAFRAIGGKKIIDIDEKLNITKQLGNIDGEIDKIRSKVNLSDQTVLNSKTRKSLNDLANSSVENIQFSKFLDEFRKQIVKVDLNKLADNLTTLATKLKGASAEELANRTEALAQNLRNIQATTVKKMTDATTTLEKDVNDLKVLSNNLQNVAKDVLAKLETADTYLKTKAADDVFKEVKAFKDRVIGWADQFAKHVIKQVKDDLGRCKPVANIYDGLINVHICKEVVGNFNGYWFALGWCLFFFPFLVIIAVHVAKYFRRMSFLDGFDNSARPPPYHDYKSNIPMADYDRPPPYNQYHNQSYSQH